jgi:hypothetical protein
MIRNTGDKGGKIKIRYLHPRHFAMAKWHALFSPNIYDSKKGACLKNMFPDNNPVSNTLRNQRFILRDLPGIFCRVSNFSSHFFSRSIS